MQDFTQTVKDLPVYHFFIIHSFIFFFLSFKSWAVNVTFAYKNMQKLSTFWILHFKKHNYKFLQIFLATLPLMGVNKYGYQTWCDFFWNDTSPEGRFFVILYLLQGNCSHSAAWRSKRCNVACIFDMKYKPFTY